MVVPSSAYIEALRGMTVLHYAARNVVPGHVYMWTRRGFTIAIESRSLPWGIGGIVL
jgi:hypothetical protein